MSTPVFLRVGLEIYWPQGQHGRMRGVWTISECCEGSEYLRLTDDYGQHARRTKNELRDTIEKGYAVEYTAGAPRAVRNKLSYVDGRWGDFRHIHRIVIEEATYFYALTTFTRELVGVVTEGGRRVRKSGVVQAIQEMLASATQ